MKKIGFIGTGIMGKSMIRNLMKAGNEVTVYSRTKSKAEDIISEGARWCDTPKECAKGQDAVITIVGYPKDVEEVYFGENGILEGAKKGAYLIDMTTSSPGLAVRIYEEAKDRDIHVMDAPVSGGDKGAKEGTLSIMAGGDKEDFEACRDIFEAMGKNIIYEGEIGSGQHTKMANQIAIAGTISGVCEALAYAKEMDLDVKKTFDSIHAGAAGSWQMENLGVKMMQGDLNPGFFLKHFIKDMRIAVEEATSRGLTFDILEETLSHYEDLAEDGKGDLGTQALITYYTEL